MQSPALITPAVSRRHLLSDYLSLTKPRVISLLLFTTLAAMLVAGGLPSLTTLLAVTLGGYLAAGGAGALNCYLDRDMDGVMARTRRRPLPSGRLQPQQALRFGLALSALSFVVLWAGANLLAAGLALAGNLFYVLIYTYWLKRRSVQNIVIGGAAGAFPPLVGWAAVTGHLAPLAWFMFLVIFCWTPPHFWALALVKQPDYARAGVPMLPVVQGARHTARLIAAYALVLVGLSLAPALGGGLGPLYLVGALLLGGLLLAYVVQLLRHTTVRAAWRLYLFSLVYLAGLFAAMALERLVA